MAGQLKDLIDNIPEVYIRHLNAFWSSFAFTYEALKHGDYDLVCYFGHGRPDKWKDGLGYVMGEGFADAFKKTAIVFAFACESLQSFGKKVVENGAGAYIGNSQPVWHVNVTTPVNVSRAFKSVWFNEVVNLLRGVPVKECVTFAKNQWKDLAVQLSGTEYAPLAFLNGEHHGYVGNGELHLPAVVKTDGSNLDWNQMLW